MKGMIAAVSKNGIIGVDNTLPFNYSADMKHFRSATANSTIIMGRKTFESIGRPLPKRRNIVISSATVAVEGIETFDSIAKAVESAAPNQNLWFIGGASIYEEAMRYVDKIVLTVTPDMIAAPNAVKFPWINPTMFTVSESYKLPDDDKLIVYNYTKI